VRFSAWLKGSPTRPDHFVPRLEALEDRCLLAVTYGGGHLLTSVQVQALYYGDQWGADPTLTQQRTYLEGYLQYLVNSPYMDLLQNAGYGVGRGTSSTGGLDSIGLPTVIDDSLNIQGDLTAAIKAGLVQKPGAVSSNHLYVVFVEPGVEVTLGNANSKINFAGYHNAYTATIDGQTDNIYYAVIPYPGGINYGAFGLPNDPLNTITEVTSHEVAEGCTDPDVSTGWAVFDPTDPHFGEEIGDIVNGQATSLNGYAVQKEPDKNENTLIPSGALDFDTVSLTESSSFLVVNQSVTLTATLSNYVDVYGVQTNPNPFTGTVDFYDGNTLLASAPVQTVNGIQEATLTPALSGGNHSLTAKYRGDAHFLGSTSFALAATVLQTSSSTQVSVSSTTVTAGQPLVFTATVSPGTSGALLPGGTVNFYLDGSSTPVGSGTLQLVNGVETATFSSSTLSPGFHNVTAVYQGDASFQGSAAAGVPFTVLGVATTTSVSSSLQPSLFGQAVTLTATVTAAGSGVTPGGSVEFFAGPVDLGAGTAQGGTGNSATWTITTSTLPSGANSIRAVYTPATIFQGSSGTFTQDVKAGTVTSVSSNLSSVNFGQSVTFTAIITNSNGNVPPTGSVEFFNGSTDLGAGAIFSLGANTISSIFTTASLPVGLDNVQAVFTAAGDFVGSQGSTNQTVSALTSTSAFSNGNPSVFGHAVVLTATVTDTSAVVTPTGSVEFFAGNVDLGAGTALSGSGNSATSTLTTSSLPPGLDTIKAVFNPTGTFVGSQSSFSQHVQAVTTTAVSSGKNPSTFGNSVPFTATITNTSSSSAPPTGRVEFFFGSIDLGPGSFLSGAGSTATSTFTTSTLPIGVDNVLAVYTATGDFVGSQGSLNQTVNASTTTSVSSSSNPSVFGHSVTLTATVTDTSSSTLKPAGSVEFFDGTVDLGTGTAQGGTGASATWTLTTTTLPSGANAIKAVFNPTGAFLSSSGTLPQHVQAITTTAVASSKNPSTFGDSVTYTATITNTSGGAPPAGSIEFFNGSIDLGPGSTLTANGNVATSTFSTSALPAGVDNVSAVYTPAAGADFVGSQGSLSQTVNAITTTALTSSANPSLVGSAVTLSATVTDTSSSTLAPTGSMEFFDGSTDLGAGTAQGSIQGSTTWTLTASGLALGQHKLKAVYTPKGTFVGSQGTFTQTVAPLVLPAILQADGSLLLGAGANGMISPAGTILAASAAVDGSGFEHVFAIVKGFDAATAGNLWEYTSGPTAGWAPRSVGHFQSISAATNAAGNAVVFGILSNGNLWEYSSLFSPNTGFFGQLSNGSFLSISAVTDSKGNDVVFAITADTNLWQHSPSILGGWVQLSNGSFTAISAGVDGAGQAEVFGILAGGSLWVNDPPAGVQPALNQFWTQLSPVAANSPSTVLAITAAGRDEVFATDGNQALWQHTGAGWTLIDATHSWAQLSATVDPSGIDQVFGTLSDTSLAEYSPALPSNHLQTLLAGGAASTSTPRRPGF
jgi:hypothetical protein